MDRDLYGERVLVDFGNVGAGTLGRAFPGLPAQTDAIPFTVAPRDAVHLRLSAGDLVSVLDGMVACAAFDERGACGLERLGLTAVGTVDADRFDTAALYGWMAAHGAVADQVVPTARITTDGEAAVMRAEAPVDVWFIHEAAPNDLVSATHDGATRLSVKRAARADGVMLPPPLGAIRDEFTVKRGTAQAYEIAAGETVQIIDVDGQQCSDFMAFGARALDLGQEGMIDSTATRSMVRRAYPGPGLFDKFYDRDMRPMLQLVQDTCGQHDTFGLACTARGYEERGFPGHLNCSDNISDAVDRFGIARRAAWPAINFFWRTWVDPYTQHILTEESHSRPGDYVAMRALEPLVCVSTACPDDIDPINGWNPTDIHVRIYEKDAPIRRAVAYREKENAPMSLSQPSAFHARTEALTPHFAAARDLWVPSSYPATGAIGEYWACRDRVTVQDMSGLRKFDIIGPDAERLLQMAMTRDIARLALWRGTYALMCDDAGEVIDDGTLFRIGPELFRWCCGSEESGRALQSLADAQGFKVRVHALGNRLPNLALQGPRSRDLLRKIVFTQPHVPSLDQMKWFGVTIARLRDREGLPFMLSRSGYTGELGYELFCAEGDAVALWDAIVEAGEEYGLVPMGNDALNTIRIEAGLAAAGAELAAGVDAYEAGLGFAVDLRKTAFVGKDALVRNADAQRRVFRGLIFDVDDVPHSGAPVLLGERQVGVVTSAARSPALERAIAMARISVEHAEIGTSLDVGMMDGRIKRLTGTVCDTPFVDPARSRARA
ncbi:MAG: DUF1989 domain-containing protein [Tateyamaria sp.]